MLTVAWVPSVKKIAVNMAVKFKDVKTSSEVGVLPIPNSKSPGLWWMVFGACVFMTIRTGLYKISQPVWVCWDETRLGKIAFWYINRTFLFDVHPTLGKMLIAGMGYTTGYNGTHPVEKPGNLYEDHSYLGMRVGCTLLGCAIAPFSFLTV